jgi:integrase
MNKRARGSGRIFKYRDSVNLWCAYYLRGKEYRQSTHETDPIKAEKFLKRKIKEVGADQIGAKAFVGPDQQRLRVGEMLNALEADFKLRGKASPQFQSHLKTIRAYFGDWRALEVTPEKVDKFIGEMQDADYADATINRATQLLGQAFALAVERKHLSTAPKIRHLSEAGNARQGFFSDAEFQAVLSFLPEYLRDFARFGYMVGWRKGEIISLRWEDVDGDCIRLRGVNSKNGDGRLVPLDGELAELMERRKAARQVEKGDTVMLSDLIFHLDGEPVGDFRKSWQTACVKASLGDFACPACELPVDGHECPACKGASQYSGKLFHDFRRTAVRNSIRAGVNESVAMKISGHKTRSVFDRYNITSEADLRDAMRKTGTYRKDTAEQDKKLVVMRQAGGGN